MKIMPNNLLREFEQYQEEFEEAAIATLCSGWRGGHYGLE